MNTFLKISGATVIGLAIGFAATFPIAVIGAAVGWFFIEEEMGGKDE